jgi:DNA-binding transcriptional LysR family regulator
VLRDPLLVRGPGGTLVATPRADALAGPLRAALGELAAVIRSPAPFDPRTAQRTFHLGTSDYVELVLLPRLVERLGRLAPGVDLWVHAVTDFGDAGLADGSLDAVVGPPRGTARLAGCFEKHLFHETFTCVARSAHPLARKRLTLARYCSAPHLLVAPRGKPGSFVDDALAAVGRRRRIALAVPHFLVVPHVVAASDLIATLATRVTALFAPLLGLARLPPPLPISGFAMALAWHERQHQDAAHRWFREQIVAVAGDLAIAKSESTALENRGHSRLQTKRRMLA